MEIKELIENQLNPQVKVPTYVVKIICGNCGHYADNGTMMGSAWEMHRVPAKVKIPKGKPAQPLLNDVVCKNCGCKGFMRPWI
jgi:hypothetical protein